MQVKRLPLWTVCSSPRRWKYLFDMVRYMYQKISDNGYISVASGCGGLVFGLRSDGTVDVLFSEKDTIESLAM